MLNNLIGFDRRGHPVLPNTGIPIATDGSKFNVILGNQIAGPPESGANRNGATINAAVGLVSPEMGFLASTDTDGSGRGSASSPYAPPNATALGETWSLPASIDDPAPFGGFARFDPSSYAVAAFGGFSTNHGVAWEGLTGTRTVPNLVTGHAG